MKMESMISTGAMLFIGVIALKAFGGIEGITNIFKGFGELLTIGGGTGVAPPFAPPWAVPPDMPPDVVPEIPPYAPPDFWEFLFPPLAILPDEPPEIPPPIQPPPPVSWIFPPLALYDLINPPKVTAPSTPTPSYTPTIPPVYQPPSDPLLDLIIPSDPGHPATDPFLGGR